MPPRLVNMSDSLPSAAPRIYKVDVARLRVAGYDVDNGYPQRMESLINASPTAKQAVDKMAEFIIGQGFDKDQDFWNAIVNSDGQTGDELLEDIAPDFAKFKNFALHINYNALFGGVEVKRVPFKHCRLGINDQSGKVAVSPNWWTQDRFGRYVREKDIDYIDMFNPVAEAIKAQVSAAGGWKKYKGQIYLFSPEYTLATCDPVLDWMEAEILAGQTSKSNIKNNFGDKTVWLQPEDERFAADVTNERNPYASQDEFTESLQEWVGPDAPQLIAAFYKNEADKPSFITIENKLDDKRFAYTIETARGTIYRNYNQPAILHSDLTQGRYNQNQLPEAMKYYNNNTESLRIKVQRAFTKVFGVFQTKFKADFSITPLNDMTSATTNTEGANSNNGGQQDADIQE